MVIVVVVTLETCTHSNEPLLVRLVNYFYTQAAH